MSFGQRLRESLEVRAYAESRREREFTSLERQRLTTDQVTEASERLNGAMENVFDYTYQGGDFYFQGQSIREVLEIGLRNAQELVKSKPQFSVELLRRCIELQQYNEQIALVQNVDWENPLVLVHISPTPDAVLNEGVDLNAYDVKRKKIMVRITEPMLDGVRVTSLSLDAGDRVALQAVADIFGVDIPDDASSEDILAMHFLAEKSQFGGERPAKVLRERYDAAMTMQYGGQWYAGRRDTSVFTTMQKIMRYPTLVEQHVDEVMALKRRFGKDFRFTPEYEKATYNFLAAIEVSDKQGYVVANMGDAGTAAAAAGVEFAKPDCPTGSAATAEQVLGQQGIGERQWHHGTCQACQEDTMVGECNVCASCEAADNRGVDLLEVRRQALAKIALAQSRPESLATKGSTANERRSSSAFAEGVKQIFGRHALAKERVTVGGTTIDIVTASGEMLAANVKRSELAMGA